jgi:transposase-like protein
MRSESLLRRPRVARIDVTVGLSTRFPISRSSQAKTCEFNFDDRQHFQDEVILLCVRWYLRYSLSYRDLEELMTERSLSVDHSTIARWVSHYAPILHQRMRRHLRHQNRSWRVDETYVRVAGRWTCLYRALNSEGNTIDLCFLRIGTGSPRSTSCNWLCGV